MKQIMSSDVLAAAVAIAATLCVLEFVQVTPNADLIAAWIAGQHLSLGLNDQIYPGYAGVFTLHPHPNWPAFAEAERYRGPVFPFIYPPIWAWAMSHIETIEGFRAFARTALVANSAMLMGTVWLAMRATGAGLMPVLYVAGGAALLGASHAGLIPLMQGQPQILVAFLLVLAIERSRADDEITAGAALALAAAIKLYPAIFALIWLATGERRALAAFALVGGGLAALSVGLTGWDLHAAFLADMTAVSNTVLVTGMTTNIHSLVAQFAFADELVRLRPVEAGSTPPPDAAWHYLAMGPVFAVASKGLLATVMAGVLWAARQASPETRATIVWPIALAAVALSLPISWSYYFIPALAFLPGIAWRLGPIWGTLVFTAVLAAISQPAMRAFGDLQPQLVTLPFILLLLAMLAAAHRRFEALRKAFHTQKTGVSTAA